MGNYSIEELWSYVCDGDNRALLNYYKNGGQPNRRFNAGMRVNSLLMGAYRNRNWSTVKLLKKYGETLTQEEYAAFKYEAEGAKMMLYMIDELKFS